MVSNPKLRVFLDINVIFSGLYSGRGAPGIILEHFIEGRINLVVSPQVLEELIRTLKVKIPEALPALKRLLVNAPPEIVADPSPKAIQRWAKELHWADAAILAAAIAAKPDYFVSGDNHFLENRPVMEKSRLNIVAPAQFLKLMEMDNPY